MSGADWFRMMIRRTRVHAREMHFMSVLLATLAAGSASEVGPSENINCTYMLNKLTQRKPVLGERAADAARQHAHIDTNRTYNETTRDRTYSSRTQS